MTEPDKTSGDGAHAPEGADAGAPTLKQKLELLPREPGVYLFRDADGDIIYVGKAKVLRSRVRSYFSGRADGRYQFPLLVRRIADVETIVTDNEIEALILEANLIRRHRPRFNVDVRDDASYPYLKVTSEPYPRVFLTRNPREDGSKYYGPLTDVSRAKDTVNTLRKACHVRTCNLKINADSIRQGKHKVCLEYHLGNCLGPCEGLVSRGEYHDELKLLVDAVHGRAAPLVRNLEQRMKEYSNALQFEEAAQIRDQIEQTKKLSIRQKVLERDELDRDIFGYAQTDRDGCMAVLRMRSGRVIGRSHSYLTRLEGRDRAEIWQRYLADHYVPETRTVPDEVLVPEEVDEQDRELLTGFLERKKGRRVKLITPQRGKKLRLMDLARHNAELLLQEKLEARAAAERVPQSLKMLAEHLDLEEIPRTVECFDNSNLFGQQPVAAMVRFKDARPEKSQYRHYRIKTVVGIDDFASMQEVVGRRYRRLLKEDPELIPDLVLIDGGAGQVNAARRILDNLGLQEVPLVGLAKRLEEIVFPARSETITLPKTSSALRLLMQVRDEAHRFAITYHRKLRSRAQVSSSLLEIEGVGEARARALLRHFGSLKRLRAATPAQVAQVPGFSEAGARKLLDELNGGDTRDAAQGEP